MEISESPALNGICPADVVAYWPRVPFLISADVPTQLNAQYAKVIERSTPIFSQDCALCWPLMLCEPGRSNKPCRLAVTYSF